jgi:hypothetical protein
MAHLERITAVGLSVDHLHQLLVDSFTGAVPLSPVVTRSTAIFRHPDVLRVVQGFEG